MTRHRSLTLLSSLATFLLVTTLDKPRSHAAPDGGPPPAATPPAAGARQAAGPAGSLLIVEEHAGSPLVTLVVAARTGSAADPKNKEGLAHLTAELARRGAAGRPRAALEDALDALGASLHVDVDPDATELWGQVLLRNLDPFLDLLADIVLRPDFSAAELGRTRQELVADIEEARNDDRDLAGRFFERRLYGAHPYGHAPEGTTRSLPRIRREDVVAHHRRVFVGGNLIFAASGALSLPDLEARLATRFARLPAGAGPPPVSEPAPPLPEGWRLQLVNKPDRQQTTILFGQPSLPAQHPDRLALHLAMASFGGGAMNATLMDEVRTKRGLAYGAYMSYSGRRGPGAVRAAITTARSRTVTTLKLVLRLYRKLHKEGLTAERLAFVQSYLTGALAADMDDPAHRLAARVRAEINGLPPDEVDTLPDRLRAVTQPEVQAAIQKHLDPDRLAITLVATAPTLLPLLLKSGIEEGAIDVVPYDQE